MFEGFEGEKRPNKKNQPRILQTCWFKSLYKSRKSKPLAMVYHRLNLTDKVLYHPMKRSFHLQLILILTEHPTAKYMQSIFK